MRKNKRSGMVTVHARLNCCPGWTTLKMVTQDKKKGEDIMRKYKENGQLDAVCCNMCGKKMV